MNARQRRVARRKNDFRTVDLGDVQVNIYGPKSEAFRIAQRQVAALRARYPRPVAPQVSRFFISQERPADNTPAACEALPWVQIGSGAEVSR